MFSSADKSLKEEMCLLLLSDGSLVTQFVFIHITSVVTPVHIFMAKNRASENCLITELCFHHFGCVPIYISGFHYKQFASNYKNFTFVGFSSQMSAY